MDDKAVAKWIIQQHYSIIWGLDYKALGKDLAVRVKEFPGIVYLVFGELEEQKYDSSTIIYVARNFLDNTDQSTLNYIGKTTDGNILLAKVQAILKCDVSDNKSAGRCVSIDAALITNNGEAKPERKTNNSAQPQKLSDAEIKFYREYNQTGDAMWNKVNGVWNQKGPRVKFNDEICWDLPTKGTGFVIYNQDDLKGKRKDKFGYDQIGTKETIEAMIKMAELWHSRHSDRLLQYGDISRPGGINTPDHGTHYDRQGFRYAYSQKRCKSRRL